MSVPSRLWVVTLLLGTSLTWVGCHTGGQPAGELSLLESHTPSEVPRYDVLELSFQHNGAYRDNFLDVDLETILKSPSGVEHRIKGFFYGRDLWKVRFRPDEAGTWTYSYTFAGAGGFRRQGRGTFRCTPSNEDGPVRRSSDNRFRWVFADDKPYFPIGLQDCTYINGGRLQDLVIDGEGRRQPGRTVSIDEYFAIYGHAGFNLLRFSQKNCSYSLMDDLDHYRVAESIATDDLLSLARKNGFRIMFGFFGFHGKQQSDIRALNVLERAMNNALGRPTEAIETPEKSALVEKEKRFVAYCVARWGVYADFWELLNERKASDQWTTLMADYVHSVDPDHKPISTSWEKANLPAIDINAPHWYESENELNSDLRVQQLASKWKQPGKPVIVGEQGNVGMNWDLRSGVRMRIRAWTAFFQEISLVFWNTSWSKQGMNHGRYTPGAASNIYLGPEERAYVRVLQDFANRLGTDVRLARVSFTSPTPARAYGLVSKHAAGVYVQHADNHTAPVEHAEIIFDFSPFGHQQLIGEWIDPATGAMVSRVKVQPGIAKLQVPPFIVDIALLISSDGAPLSLLRETDAGGNDCQRSDLARSHSHAGGNANRSCRRQSGAVSEGRSPRELRREFALANSAKHLSYRGSA